MSFMKDFWVYRYNFLLAILWVVLMGQLPSSNLYEWSLPGIVGALILAGFHLQKSDRTGSGKIKRIDVVILILTAFVSTAMYWFRAWDGLPAQISLEPVFRVIAIIGFWWPGVLYASLFRYSDDGWWPKSRQRFLKTVTIGMMASLAGIVTSMLFLNLQ